jgi:hypothetical protein
MAMENTPAIDEFTITTTSFRGFSIAGLTKGYIH